MKISIRSLRKTYDGQTVVEIDRMDCEFTHCLALIGPSGGGKSTLLRLIGGLETPDEGQIVIDGEVVPRSGGALLAYRRSIGTVFQAFNLFPHMDALQNVVLPLTEVHGVPRAEAETRARDLLERFGLASHAHKRPSMLSGGQRQRVAIVRAVAIRPRFLLLDEPTSALDPEMTAEVLELLDDLRRSDCPILLVTHEIGFARHAADMLGFLRAGTVEALSRTDTFFSEPPSSEASRFLEKTLRFSGGTASPVPRAP
jgi:polar amino acid transport system ATP-binding protein